MILNFCTLFDSYYLTRGLALYYSLEKVCEDFHLYIFSFDDKSFDILENLKLRHATIISLKDFENDDLLRVKPTRTIAEYCWTCTASIIWYSIDKFTLDQCTYLDADMLFYTSPKIILEEIGDNSIAITPHNFSKKQKSSEIYGKYCVQFTYFKNDQNGLSALKWWKDSCIEWCYAKLENGKYGDQKYLDYFEEKFKKVHIISNIGAGLAPWNVLNYSFELAYNNVILKQKSNSVNKKSLVFYHFQGLKFKEINSEIIVRPSLLKIPEFIINEIYKPYVIVLIEIRQTIECNTIICNCIRFKRNMFDSIAISIRNRLKKYRLIQLIYYFFKRNRYNRPIDIGV